MSDDRPKKTWKELDAARDRGGQRTKRDPDARAQQAVEKTAAYSKYKSKLDKLFTPGGDALPEHMKAALGPASASSQDQRAKMEALKATPNQETLAAYLGAGHVLPEDPRLLTGLLDVRDDELLKTVLNALLQIVEGGKKPNRMLVLQRLKALETFAEDEDTLALARTLRAALD